MDAFAKLFETELRGQIVVIMQSNDEGRPEIRFFIQPKGLGVCSLALTFDDSDEGWDKCEDAFSKIDEEKSLSITHKVFEQFGGCL